MEINAFHVNISKGSKHIPFLPPVYKLSIARRILILQLVHTKALRNADNLIKVSYFVNCNTNCNKEL